MNIHNLDSLFKPSSIALIGASSRPSSVGAVVTRNLLQSGFAGPVMLVNPKRRSIGEQTVYADIQSLPVVPELAVVTTPPASVPGIIAELGDKGTRAAVVISAGFSEVSAEAGKGLQKALLDAARLSAIRVIGPNCLGILVPGSRVNASFSHIAPENGKLAFVTQSGAIVTAMVDWAQERGIGFSHLVSLGDMADVDFGDMIDYLARDPGTRSILLYIEAVTSVRKFMSAARAAARAKPVIVVKAGRFEEGARAAASHTGALAGSDVVYDALFRRAGLLRVTTLEELFDAAETLSMISRVGGDRLVILTNGGGMGVLATDRLIQLGGRLAELAPATIEGLNRVLPPTWSHGNPVDIIGDASGDRYADTYKLLIKDPGVDAVLALNCPTAVASSSEAARALIDSVPANSHRPLFTSWVGEGQVRAPRKLFSKHAIPTFDTPEQAVSAFMYLVDYQRNQDNLTQTPPSLPEIISPDSGRVRNLVAVALAARRAWLDTQETMELLSAYGIPCVVRHMAKNPEQAATIAAEMGQPVVLKISSGDILHKSDAGGVALALEGPAAVREAASHMLQQVSRRHPQAQIAGFTLEPMVARRAAYELIVGVAEDAQLGPMVIFGHGGTAVEIVDDKSIGLPPLNMHLALDMISRTRISRQLQGYRGFPAVDMDAIALTLIKLSQLVSDIPEIVELDINPLLADSSGVLALDARIRVRQSNIAAGERLAIRPYPKELEEIIPLGDGRNLLLRPILPEDEPRLQQGFSKLTPEEIRLRFFVPIKTLTHAMAARFAQLDYDREMALVLTEPGLPGMTEIFGVVRIIADPDNIGGEFAIIVSHELTGLGLGVLLMRRIIDYARNRGMKTIFGDVLQENRSMLKLCQVFRFCLSRVPDEPGIVRVTLNL